MKEKKPTAGVILAAGESIRFGKPKQLLKLNDKYLIERVLDAAMASRLEKTFLVLGHQHQKILDALGKIARQSDLKIIINPDYQHGQSTSLRAGVATIQNTYPSVMFILADQPMLNADIIDALLKHFWASDKDICAPAYKGKRGNPVIFGHKFYGHLTEIKGDIGARNIIKTYPDHVKEVEINDPLCFMDIDTQGDYDKLVEILKQRRIAR